MAIDTLDKRWSAHRAANPWARILPEADSNVVAADRAHAAGYYGGLFTGDQLDIAPENALGPDLAYRNIGPD